MDGKPVPKARARKGAGGRWYTPEETSGFEESVSRGVQRAPPCWRSDGRIAQCQMELYLFIPMAEVVDEEKAKEHMGSVHTQTPDLDNYVKAVEPMPAKVSST